MKEQTALWKTAVFQCLVKLRHAKKVPPSHTFVPQLGETKPSALSPCKGRESVESDANSVYPSNRHTSVAPVWGVFCLGQWQRLGRGGVVFHNMMAKTKTTTRTRKWLHQQFKTNINWQKLHSLWASPRHLQWSQRSIAAGCPDTPWTAGQTWSLVPPPSVWWSSLASLRTETRRILLRSRFLSANGSERKFVAVDTCGFQARVRLNWFGWQYKSMSYTRGLWFWSCIWPSVSETGWLFWALLWDHIFSFHRARTFVLTSCTLKKSRKSLSEQMTIPLNWLDIRAATHEKKSWASSVESVSFCGIKYCHFSFLSKNALAHRGIHLQTKQQENYFRLSHPIYVKM